MVNDNNLKLENTISMVFSFMKLSIKGNKVKVLTLLILLIVLISIIDPVFGQNDKVKKLTGGKINKVKVIYATDGYMVDSKGSTEHFIFGVVQIHKKWAPENEWQDPLLYFEFKNKRTFAGVGKIELFNDDLHVKRLYTSATDYNYAKYNRSEHAAKGLSMGATPHEFELDLIFNNDGTIDTLKSSMGIIPNNYKTGRKVKSLEQNGEYYKKGSKTEKAAVIRNETGYILNKEELGDPVEVEGTATVDEVCFDYYGAISPPTSPTHWKEIEKSLPFNPEEDAPKVEASPAPEITTGSHPDAKETPVERPRKKKGTVDPYKSTGLCSIYKIQSISRSQSLPNAEELGIILKME